MVLTQGDIAFTSFNADEDGWSVVTFVDIDPNTTIYFTDNEATSTTAFNTGESSFQWNTGTSTITAGTVIRFSAIDASSRAASIGTFTVVDSSNLGLSASNETIYAYLGTSDTAPTTFLAAVSSEGTTNLTPAGLTNGVNAVVLTNSTDYGVYNGSRSGESSFANYRALINNVSNWTIDTTNDYSTTVPDTTNFTITSLAPNIQITEYMYSGGNGEFIEFTNLGTTPVDMTGWSFDDDSRTPGSFSLSAFGTLQVGESVILTETDANTFHTAWGLAPTVKVIGGLNSNNLGRNDEINLYDNNNQLVDRLTYGDQNNPGTIRTQNVSGWTEATNLDDTTTTNWRLSSVNDAQNSRTSTGGDVGNPGIYNTGTTPTPGAPTIQADNETIIDPETVTAFLSIPDNSPSGSPTAFVSGVINDPTDPARTIGIEFNVSDTETAAGSLTVTATSSNSAVVTDANLVITGTNNSRNLKINPTGVGQADITVTVSDGSLTNSYVIKYAASAVSGTPTTTRFHTGASDASTAIAIDANYMFVGNDEDQTIRLYDRNDSGLPLTSFDFTSSLGLQGSSEVDIEASTRISNTIYWLGSHANNSSAEDRPNRERIFATDISGTGNNATLSFQGYYRFLEDDLIAWDNNNGHGLGAGFLGLAASAAEGVQPEGTNGFNIEGLTIAPNGTRAYVSFRAPTEPTTNRSQALIVPVTNFTNLLSPTGGTQGSATFDAPIFLDLGGRGIRSIERNSNNEYLIVAGPSGAATGITPNDFRLYTWTGNSTDAPELRAADLTALNAGGSFESIVEIPNSLNSASQLQLLVDNGDTDWYNNGQASKDLTQNFQKFRSEIVTSGDTIGQVYNGTSGRDSFTGTEGNDTIIGGAGGDILTGGAGYDKFVYTNIRDRGDTITDFKVGTDKIVFTQLLDSLVSGGYNGTNAIADNYVRVVQGSSSSNFNVQIDSDGQTGADIFRPFITVNLASTSIGTLNDVRNFIF